MTQEQLQKQFDKATVELEQSIAEYLKIAEEMTDGELEKFSGNEFLSNRANFLAKITQTPEMRERRYNTENYKDFCCASSPVKFLDFESALNSAKSYNLVSDAEYKDTAGEQLADVLNEIIAQYDFNEIVEYSKNFDVCALILDKVLTRAQEDLPDIESLQEAFVHENYMCSEIQLGKEAFAEEIKEKIKKDGDEWISELTSTSRAFIENHLYLDENQTLEDFAKNVLKSTRKNKRT